MLVEGKKKFAWRVKVGQVKGRRKRRRPCRWSERRDKLKKTRTSKYYASSGKKEGKMRKKKREVHSQSILREEKGKS